MSRDRTEQEQQLQDWLTRYRGLIHRVILLYRRNDADGDDLYQEIALALWRSMERFEARSSESTWIYRVALNTAISVARRRRLPVGSDQDVEGLPGLERSPEQNAELAWVYARIRTMSLIDRSLVLLYLDGNSYAEIAEIVGISVSNVGVKINRVKKRLQALVEPEEVD